MKTFQKWKMKSSINFLCQRDILSKNSWSKRVCNLSNKEIVLKCYKLVWWIKSDQVSKWIISVWGEVTEGCDFYLKMFLRKLFLRKLKMVLGFFKWVAHTFFYLKVHTSRVQRVRASHFLEIYYFVEILSISK